LPQARVKRYSRRITPLLWALAWVVPAGAAPGIGGSVSASTDYILRGVSQTQNQAVVQADLHLALRDSWSVGIWASPVRLLPASKTLELNLYSQWRLPVSSSASATVGAIYYTFPNDPRSVPYNYVELSGGLSWRDRILFNAYLAPDVTVFSLTYGRATHRRTWSAELAVSQPLAWQLQLRAGVGYYDAVGLRDAGYSYGSAGITRELGRFQAELSYVWVAAAQHRSYSIGPAGGPLNATLSWRF
jgi:uncharacterized protein (TIGR02001 family)